MIDLRKNYFFETYKQNFKTSNKLIVNYSSKYFQA